ncbi:Maintenance of ploidy protein mob2 [Leucoagaricus gongylophorus]
MSLFGRPRAPRGTRRSPTPGSAPSYTRQGTLSQPPSAALGKDDGKPLYLCSPFVNSALVKGNFKTIVVLPKYVDIMEWVAVNIFDFFTNLNEFCGVLVECCTQMTCPTMSAGHNLNYLWQQASGKFVPMTAPQYIDTVMSSIQIMLNDELVFPTNTNHEFQRAFPGISRHIYRQLLRIFAHIYHAHFHQILHLRAEPHFNSLFAHFLAFGREFDLLEIKEILGDPSAGPQGVMPGIALLFEKWRELGTLEK